MDNDKTNKIMALIIVIGLAGLLLALPVYPCTYYDAEDRAGYGYHSLIDIMMNGVEWEVPELQNSFSGYTGDGPYMVSPASWIMLLYIPIFALIGLLGIEVSKSGWRSLIPSKA